LTGPALAADPSAVSPPHAADPLAEALPILQAKYVDFKALNYMAGEPLSDLVARSNGGISLSAPETAYPPVPIITATLPDGVIYWRMATFTLPQGKSWPDLAAQLQQASGTAPGIILDLRSNTTPDDYKGAEQMLNFFGPAYTEIGGRRADSTSDQKPSTPLVRSPIVVLTNNGTVGAAEALAGFLQADGALVVGRATAGKVAVFQECKLSSGQVLRYVVSATRSDDPANAFKFRSETPAWDRPVIPDINVAVDDPSEKAALVLIKDNHLLDVIEESPERHRLSEAALVQGQDPEWDDYLASLEKGPVLLSLPLIHDVVLISALDSLRAIRLSQRPLPAQATANAAPPASSSLQ
jgi:hypothetical protein